MFDRVILATRHVLVVFYLGLAVALVLFAARYALDVWEMALGLFDGEDTDILLKLLHLVDYALIASLVVMVALSSYDSYVSKLTTDAEQRQIPWVSQLTSTDIKIKVATSIVAISSIELLQMFLRIKSYEDREVMWGIVIHGVFLVGALMLGLLDRMEGAASKEPDA